MRHVTTERYIVTSSMSVYPTFHDNLVEKDFDPTAHAYRLVTSEQVNYAEGKRSVEEILSQNTHKIRHLSAFLMWWELMTIPKDCLSIFNPFVKKSHVY